MERQERAECICCAWSWLASLFLYPVSLHLDLNLTSPGLKGQMITGSWLLFVERDRKLSWDTLRVTLGTVLAV